MGERNGNIRLLTTVRKACRLKLYPAKAKASAMARHAGACRWLWNHLLAMQKDVHAKTGKFVFFHDMSKMLPGLKELHPWLAEAPSNALVRVCRNLDAALKKCFREKAGFPKFKKKGVSKESFYVINQALRVSDDGRHVTLPKLGPVRFRAGRLPEGRIVGATVLLRAGTWWCTVQCEVEVDVPAVVPVAETVNGADAGTKDLLVTSDGERVKAPRHLRAAQKRLKRAQKVLSRRKKGSSNRTKQARIVAKLHAQVADRRADFIHKATRGLVDRSSAVVTEDPNIKGMVRNRRLALSLHDAGLGETLRQIGYKCEWAGKANVRAGRFEPTTQTCSSCGTRKTGAEKLTLSERTYRCGSCGLEIDRDLNAALNLRRLGLEALGLEVTYDVGQAMPERAEEIRLPADTCGEASGGGGIHVPPSRASRKQEPEDRSTELSG